MEKQQLEATDAYLQLRERYANFAVSPLKTRAEVNESFDKLLHVPGIVSVEFHEDDILMLGTEDIIIQYPPHNSWHSVGNFIIFIVRYYANDYWNVAFRFFNASNQLYGFGFGAPGDVYLHPHIITTTYDLIEAPTGKLCIVDGYHHIYQRIRRGEIHLAAPLLLQVLRTYDRHGEYISLTNWETVWESTDV